jgi:hypothetical protein
MNPENRKYILDNIGKKSIEEIASYLHLKERVIRRFLEKEKVVLAKKPEDVKGVVVPKIKSSTVLLVSLILIITFAAFSPCLKNGFVNWDDDMYVTENSAIQDFSLHGVKDIFTSFFFGNYQPVTMLSYLIEYKFFKLNPFGYHLTNLILHLLNCLLVFWLIYVLTRRISPR